MIYTVGYQGREPEEVLTLLTSADIDVVVDVRRHPVSRWKPGFSKSRLRELLDGEGIRYEHVRALGAPSALRKILAAEGDMAAFRSGYRSHLDQCEHELRRLRQLIEDFTVCLLCYERNPRECHRDMVAERAASTGAHHKQVRHIGWPNAD